MRARKSGAGTVNETYPTAPPTRPASVSLPPAPDANLPDPPPDELTELTTSSLTKWRNSLLNLTLRNRLLNFKPTETSSIQLVNTTPETILEHLAAGKPVHIPGDTPGSGLRSNLDWVRLAKTTKNLRDRATMHYLDTGLHVLYLAVGTLTWTDPSDNEPHTAPLYLVPIDFQKTYDGTDTTTITLSTAEEPASNETLTLKTKDFGVHLPTLTELDPGALNLPLTDQWRLIRDTAARIARTKTGWEANPDAMWITYFASTKEAIYKDLLDNEPLVVAHPKVRTLAASGTPLGEKHHIPPEELTSLHPDRVDDTLPPEQYLTILDADASQRQVIGAATRGHSFVVSGPPGTGKSQTIANMIAELISTGKKVLFVSEKAAALDVVHKRLHASGLSDYILELHSHKATRANVAKTLSDALTTPPDASGENLTITAEHLHASEKLRHQLNNYTLAVNETRQPAERTLHTTLGEIALLHHLPTPEPATHLAETLTPHTLTDIAAAVQQLSRVWTPAQQGETHLWWNVTETSTLRPRLENALTSLRNLNRAVNTIPLAATLEWNTDPTDATKLTALGELLRNPPPVAIPDPWWHLPDYTLVELALDTVTETIEAIRYHETQFASHFAFPWQSVPQTPTPTETELTTAVGHILALPSNVHLANFTPAHVTQLAAIVTQLHTAIKSIAVEGETLTGLLDLPAPHQLADLTLPMTIVHYAANPVPLPVEWSQLTAGNLTQLRSDAASLQRQAEECDAARRSAELYFTEEILDQNIPALYERFATVHTGVRKLGGQYRDDKNILIACSPPHQHANIKTLPEHLPKAVRWAETRTQMQRMETETHQRAVRLLGDYYRGENTNWGMLHEALNRTETILTMCSPRPHTHDGNREPLSTAFRVAGGLHTDATVTDCDTALRKAYTHIAAVQKSVPLADQFATQPIARLATETLPAAHHTITAYQHAMVNLPANAGRPHTVHSTHLAYTLANTLRAFHESLPPRDDASPLSTLYAGVDTPLSDVGAALTWLKDVRMLHPEPFTLPEKLALTSPTVYPPPDLTDLTATWWNATQHVIDAFHPDRHHELETDLKHSYRTAETLLTDLIHDPDGQAEWLAYHTAVEPLRNTYQLQPVLDFCVTRNVAPHNIPHLVHKAVLAGWADHIFRTDPRLQPLREQDRTAIANEYALVDETLTTHANTTIRHRCDLQRPPITGTESGIILAEGKKKRKHMPVRNLLKYTRETTLALKPCFMMSPQSVSQYLPPDFTFDVVIFDEASQVKPEDAINSIYRGRGIIIVGDENQMPPTRFYESSALPDDGNDTWTEGESTATDFESILTLTGATAAFDTLPLQTHYRSRDETLITFSNRSFYNDSLHTFPSATTTNPDLGVELFYVPEGVYQRGTTRDNPQEAEKVVERILHHYTHRPHLTLGVIAFSQQQAAAIATALDNALAKHPNPELAEHLNQDNRLDGFFIKNLETVQGDERDTIIFSIGYGPDETGTLTNNFGPINGQGGWRRLNVAATRARNRVEVVSSILAQHIKDSDNVSVNHFRNYLDYAHRKVAPPSPRTQEEPQNAPLAPLEKSVADVIASWGYETDTNVGTAAYRVDVAVKDPNNPGSYLLAVECDGRAYHTAKTARDRDRLRPAILQGLGWRTYHVWDTAWYKHRETAETALRAVLHAAEGGKAGVQPSTPNPAKTPLVDARETAHAADSDAFTPYKPAVNIPAPPAYLKTPADPGATPFLSQQIHHIVEAEQPVHIDVVHERLRKAWNVGRVTPAMRDAITATIKTTPLVTESNQYVRLSSTPVTDSVQVRVPDGVNPPRPFRHTPPEELTEAARLTPHSATPHETVETLLALFGWANHPTERDEATPHLHALLAETQLPPHA